MGQKAQRGLRPGRQRTPGRRARLTRPPARLRAGRAGRRRARSAGRATTPARSAGPPPPVLPASRPLASAAVGGVTVGGEKRIMARIPLIPGLAEYRQRVGVGPELDQRQADEEDFHQQREDEQTQPGRKPRRRPPWYGRAWGRIATRPAGRFTE